jgi:two-component system LytT family response regulator
MFITKAQRLKTSLFYIVEKITVSKSFQSMKSYKAIIIDDDPVSIYFLETLLKTQSNIVLIGSATNLKMGNYLIMQEHPDLVFLDIQLGNQNGLSYYRSIVSKIDWSMKVIINTGHKRYLIGKSDFLYFDYLVKPYTEIEFAKVIERFLKHKIIEEEVIAQSIVESDPDEAKMFVNIDTLKGIELYPLQSIKYFFYNNDPREKRW